MHVNSSPHFPLKQRELAVVATWARTVQSPSCFDALDPGRSVEVLAVQDRPWEPVTGGWTASVSPKRVRQGSEVRRCKGSLRVSYGGEQPPEAVEAVRLKGFVLRSLPARNGTNRHPMPRGGGLWRMHLKSARFWAERSTTQPPNS